MYLNFGKRKKPYVQKEKTLKVEITNPIIIKQETPFLESKSLPVFSKEIPQPPPPPQLKPNILKQKSSYSPYMDELKQKISSRLSEFGFGKIKLNEIKLNEIKLNEIKYLKRIIKRI